MKKRALLTFLALAASPAFATDNVSSPNVEKNRFTLEYRSGYDIDDDASKNRRQSNKLVANYGITERLRPEIKAVIQNNPNQSPELDAVEMGLRYQFLEKDEAPVAAAIDGNYTIATQNGDADTFEVKLLLAKDIGDLSNIANIGLETELGEHAEDGLAVKFGWKSSYKITPYFAPGFEYYLDTGNLDDSPGYEDQTHKIGPTISGNITENLKYDIGYLWGISDSATDGRVKLIIGYAYNF